MKMGKGVFTSEKVSVSFLVVGTIFCLSACGLIDREASGPTSSDSVVVDTLLPSDPVAIEAAARMDPLIDEVLEILAAAPRDDLSKTIIPFSAPSARDSLTSTQQIMYDELLIRVKAIQPIQFLISEWGESVMDDAHAACSALLRDYPELGSYFFIDLVEPVPGQLSGVEVFYQEPSVLWGNDNPDPQRIRDEMALFDAVVDRIVQRMPADASAYDKYRYLACVQSLTTTYDYEYSRVRPDPWSGIMAGKSICTGYANTFCYLCKRAGLWCRVIEGTVAVSDENNAHAWNLGELDSGTFFVDVTWSETVSNSPGDAEWMRYFMMDQMTAGSDHFPYDGTVATGIVSARASGRGAQ